MINENNSTNNIKSEVTVTSSTVKEVKVGAAGIEKINITQVPFIPDIATMNLSTQDIVKAVNATLKPIVDIYKGAKVYVKGNVFGVQIGIDVRSQLIDKSILRMIDDKTAYEMTDELKAKLSVFINLDSYINSSIIETNKRDNTQAMIIELDAKKVIDQILQSPAEGFVYRLDRVINRKKNDEAIFQISMVKKNRPFEQRNSGGYKGKNDDGRNNNRNYNNSNNNRDNRDNYDRRDNNRNSNYKGNNYNSNYKGNNYNRDRDDRY